MSNGFIQPSLPVTVVVEPARDENTLAYAPVAPRSAGEKPMVMIAVMLRLTNHGTSPIRFERARFSFAGPPFVADTLYTQDDVLGDNPAIGPDATRDIHFSRLVTIRFSAPAPPGVTIRIYFEESDIPVTVWRSLAPHVCPVPGGAYRLPFKAYKLPPGAINNGSSGHRGSNQRYAYDTGASQWDTGAGEWRGLKPGETENTNENQVDWGLPIHAMADGVVLEFANDVPDNPHPPEKVTGGGGNHFWIRHGTDRVLYAHMIEGSLNPDLLEEGAAVSSGQFLGLLGNSGSSTGAHLHIHALREADDVFQPLLFSGGWVVERDLLVDGELSAPWSRLEGQVLPFERSAIWAAPFLPMNIVRVADSGDQHHVEAVQAAATGPDELVTAIQAANDRLRVLSWSVSSDGETVAVVGDSGSQAGNVNLIRVMPLGFGLVCTPVTTADGRLKLIVWQLADGGAQVNRLGDSGNQAGVASEIDAVHLGAGQVATIVQTAQNRRKVILWGVPHDGQSVDRLGDTGNNGPIADLVSIAAAGLGRFVTAFRREDGRLVVEVWESSPDGTAIELKSDSGDAAGEIGDVRVATLATSQVVTAVRAKNGELKLIAWSIAADGTLNRTGDSGDQAGAVQMISLAQPEPEVLVTAVITESGRLKLIAWHVSPEGEITRLGDSGDAAGRTDAFACTALSPSLLVTALRTQSGRLELISWSLASVQASAVASPFLFDLQSPPASVEAVSREVADDFTITRAEPPAQRDEEGANGAREKRQPAAVT